VCGTNISIIYGFEKIQVAILLILARWDQEGSIPDPLEQIGADIFLNVLIYNAVTVDINLKIPRLPMSQIFGYISVCITPRLISSLHLDGRNRRDKIPVDVLYYMVTFVRSIPFGGGSTSCSPARLSQKRPRRRIFTCDGLKTVVYSSRQAGKGQGGLF
jgi:hypothetical protein